MSDKSPFDPNRAAFLLIAGVIAVECIVVLSGVGFCIVEAQTLVAHNRTCDPEGRLTELMSAALAAALAAVATFGRKP
jgi:hypothetical protein